MMSKDLERAAEILSAHTWKFAKTMPEIPHEYVIKHKTITPENFDFIAKCIALYGVEEPFGRRMWRYLYVGDHKYWTDGWTKDHDILNRAKIEQITP